MSQHTYQRVVLPLDGGAARSPAETVAHDLAQRLGVPLELVSVSSPGMAEIDQFQLEHEADLLGPNVNARAIVGSDVFTELAKLSDSPGTLMCLPSSGRLAWSELVSRSISARLLAAAQAPILAVGPRCTGHLAGSRMAIAIDGSPESESIAAAAVSLSAPLGLRPFFFHVRDGEDVEGSRSAAGTHLTEFDPDAPAIEVVVDDDPQVGRALERLAARGDVAIIALASHGADPAARLTSPSISHHLLRHSPCPVLVGHREAPQRDERRPQATSRGGRT